MTPADYAQRICVACWVGSCADCVARWSDRWCECTFCDWLNADPPQQLLGDP